MIGTTVTPQIMEIKIHKKQNHRSLSLCYTSSSSLDLEASMHRHPSSTALQTRAPLISSNYPVIQRASIRLAPISSDANQASKSISLISQRPKHMPTNNPCPPSRATTFLKVVSACLSSCQLGSKPTARQTPSSPPSILALPLTSCLSLPAPMMVSDFYR